MWAEGGTIGDYLAAHPNCDLMTMVSENYVYSPSSAGLILH